MVEFLSSIRGDASVFSHGVDYLRNHFSARNTVVLLETEWTFLLRESTRKGAGLKRQEKERGRLKFFMIVASFSFFRELWREEEKTKKVHLEDEISLHFG